jgi:hypothetical protein
MDFSDSIRAAHKMLAPRDGYGPVPPTAQSTAAIAHAEVAKAQAMERIAIALEALVADPVPAGVTVQPAIGHSN